MISNNNIAKNVIKTSYLSLWMGSLTLTYFLTYMVQKGQISDLTKIRFYQLASLISLSVIAVSIIILSGASIYVDKKNRDQITLDNKDNLIQITNYSPKIFSHFSTILMATSAISSIILTYEIASLFALGKIEKLTDIFTHPDRFISYACISLIILSLTTWALKNILSNKVTAQENISYDRRKEILERNLRSEEQPSYQLDGVVSNEYIDQLNRTNNERNL